MRAALLVLLLAACGEEPEPCDGKRDLLQSEAGLTLTRAEHDLGWGRTECLQCHPAWTVHQADCLDGVAVDVEGIEDATPDSCLPCHGSNGVPAWEGEP